MTTGEGQAQPTEGQVEAWFKRRFGDEIRLSEGQKGWIKANWGRHDVTKEEWESVLPPIEQKVGGIKYVLKYGEYGMWTSEKALTLKEWADVLPLDPNEPKWSQEAAKDLNKLMEFEDELAKELITAESITPPDWLIEGMLPQKTLNFIGGDAGIGKTLLALQMAACLMTGQQFLGHATQRANVLLIERDEPLHLLKSKNRQAICQIS
ncbi:AAA family ATPase [Chloroflexota bacterium]